MKIAVIGAGVSGLTVAYILQKNGHNVTIYAEKTKDIVSYVPIAQFYPILQGNSEFVPSDYNDKVLRWCKKSWEEFQNRKGEKYGIIGRRNHELFEKPEPATTLYTDLLPNFEAVADSNLPPPYKYRFSFDTLIIQPSIYLPRLTADFENLGGLFVERRFEAKEDLKELREDVIFNCSGLASNTLFSDKNLQPIKGVVIYHQPIKDDKVFSAGEFILAPRTNDCVIGCLFSYEYDSVEPTQKEVDYLFDNVKRCVETPGCITSIQIGTLSKDKIISVASGLRPYRKNGIRIEKENLGDKLIIHDYGHGGSGFISSWGTAYNAIELLN